MPDVPWGSGVGRPVNSPIGVSQGFVEVAQRQIRLAGRSGRSQDNRYRSTCESQSGPLHGHA